MDRAAFLGRLMPKENRSDLLTTGWNDFVTVCERYPDDLDDVSDISDGHATINGKKIKL
jgi:hypothetical protein